MRPQQNVVIWPSYFDASRTRKEGRRVSKNIAVALPTLPELKGAADMLGLESQIVQEYAYSKTPWLKTGMLLVKKQKPKNQTVRSIAAQLLHSRSSQKPLTKNPAKP